MFPQLCAFVAVFIICNMEHEKNSPMSRAHTWYGETFADVRHGAAGWSEQKLGSPEKG